MSSVPSAHPSSGWDNGATSLEIEPLERVFKQDTRIVHRLGARTKMQYPGGLQEMRDLGEVC